MSSSKNFVIKNEFGPVYLDDVAEINFKESEKKSYAREFAKNLVSLAVKKRSGKNLINAANKIDVIVDEVIKNEFPSDLEVVITNDMSNRIISQVDDLVNNILFGIFLVTTVLMFFLGFRNALFVGFAIPMSMFMSYVIGHINCHVDVYVNGQVDGYIDQVNGQVDGHVNALQKLNGWVRSIVWITEGYS